MKAGKWLKEFVPYVLVAIITVVVLCILYHGIDITRPLTYSGDGVSATYLVKTINDTGWFLKNPFVGGIYGANWADYTMCDNLSFLIVKFFALFTDNSFFVFNLFYFSTFVLVSLTAYAVFRALKVNPIIGMTGALLYSFLAYHQMRITHIWLTPYFMVPLGLLVGIWIATDAYQVEGLTLKQRLCDKRRIASTVILFFCAFTGFYYAFFTCVVICIAGVILLLKKANVRRILLIVYSLLVVCVGIVVNVYPSLVYWLQNGTNAESELVIRSASDAETYGLKLIQLLMPRAEHRLSALRSMAAEYFANFPLNNENETATLGVIASCGFLVLLLFLFRSKEKREYLNEIKLLNIGIFLVATIGGIGGVFGFLVSTPMRCYNRLSVYIAFLSLLFLALSMTDFVAKISASPIRRAVCIGTSLVVLAVGLWDQAVSFGEAEQAVATQSFDSDREFVQRIEEVMEPGAMVYQLPMMKFPSGTSYELYKGYMHSKATVWSYGGMQGREEDRWETNLMNYPVNEFLDHLCYGGYRGLYVDRQLFVEQGYDFEFYYQKLGMFLTDPPIISEDGRLYFWDLANYYDKISSQLGEDRMNLQKEMEYKVFTEYGRGFSEKEETIQEISRWCAKRGTIRVRYDRKKPCKCIFQGTLRTGCEKESAVTVTVNGKEHELMVNWDGTDVNIPLTLKKGENVITFTSEAPDVSGKKVSRNFRLEHPILRYE